MQTSGMLKWMSWGAGWALGVALAVVAGGSSPVRAQAQAQGQTPAPAQGPGGSGTPVVVTATPGANSAAERPATAVVTGSGAAQPVVASGVVPDEATRQALLARLREVYGAQRVVDQLQVGPVVAPANWSAYVGKLVTPALRQVGKGSLAIRGNEIELRGEVANEAQRQQLASDMATSLNPTYTIRNQLQVARAEQGGLDAVLANRIVEFQPGSAVLTPAGRQLLDEMVQALQRVGGREVEVVGHTDTSGDRAANVRLSQARADAVKAYLVERGIAAPRISAQGAGPDRPVASNATPEGRARNRRIEFRLVN